MSQATSDEQAITNLLFRYARLIDTGDFDEVGSLFSQGTYVGLPGALVADRLRSTVVLHDGKMGTKHVTTNIEIYFTNDRTDADVFSNFTVFQQTPTLPLQPIVAGRYEDKVSNVGADQAGGSTWHFVERLIHVELVGDLSNHLSRPLRL